MLALTRFPDFRRTVSLGWRLLAYEGRPQPLTKETAMFYLKNVPNWERVLRVIVGLLSLGYAVMNWGGSALAIGAGIVGAMLAMTGLFGFCPMCAMVGRKLHKGQ
jgi:hypothetical protein